MMFVACLGKTPLLVFFLSVTSVGESRAGSGTLDGTVISVGDSSPEECVWGREGVTVSIVGVLTYVTVGGTELYVTVVGTVV